VLRPLRDSRLPAFILRPWTLDLGLQAALRVLGCALCIFADWAGLIVDTRNAMASVKTKPGQVWKA
jgi:hypothetical protein